LRVLVVEAVPVPDAVGVTRLISRIRAVRRQRQKESAF